MIETEFYTHTQERRNKIPELAIEVARIRREGLEEEELYLLPDTGFNVRLQIDLLLSNIANGVSFEDSFEQLGQDMQGFKIEYLSEGVLFPIILNKRRVGSESRVQAAFYGGKLWADAISEVEREGAVKRAIVGDAFLGKMGIEQYLLTAPPGSMAILTSPPAWSGYPGIDYPDTQTYGIEVLDDGGIRGFTVKSDLKIDQNEELLMRLGVREEEFRQTLSEKDQIKRLVGNYVLLSPESAPGIGGLIDIIRDIKGSDIAFVDTRGRERTFNEAYEALENPESLWILDSPTKKLVNKFKEQVIYEVLKESIDRRNLEIGLGRIVLELAHRIRGGERQTDCEKEESMQRLFSPREILDDMQEIRGCAGGGRVIKSLIPRFGDERRTLCCTCPYCKEQVEAIIEDGTIKCPKCLKEAPWSDEGLSEAA